MTEKSPVKAFLSSRWSLLALLGLLILAAIAVPFYLTQSTLTNALSDTSYSTTLTPGSHAKLVVDVVTLQDDNSIKAWALDRNSDGTYTRSQRSVVVRWSQEMVSLGNAQDVKAGALIQVEGNVMNNGILQASQLVILTNHITVH
ncbi:MAG: hypothetical protein J2P37_03760 [Ktedonobacteraceae bacterium]|nr:hypothetical protein [Ktedonobacteraceae bacterium]